MVTSSHFYVINLMICLVINLYLLVLWKLYVCIGLDIILINRKFYSKSMSA